MAIFSYDVTQGYREIATEDDLDPGNLLWIDLRYPSADEIRRVETATGLELPTWEEMEEIESTSRLYTEAGARFMTALILVKGDSKYPERVEISFVLSPTLLITLRRSDSQPFRKAVRAFAKTPPRKPDSIFIFLIEGIVDRQADILERIGQQSDRLSEKIYSAEKTAKQSEFKLREAIYQLGRDGDLIARQRECIVSLTRLVQYAGLGDVKTKKGRYARLKPVARDLQSLSEYAAFLANKLSFMLDATLGLISIEQNAIVKIFTVAAVIFLPPTLVASIYGMNFEFMPELDKPWGYPFALGLMALSVVVPYLFCRRKGWL